MVGFLVISLLLLQHASCEVSLTEEQYQRAYELYNIEYGRNYENEKYIAFKDNLNYVANANIDVRLTKKRQSGLVTRDLTLKINQFGDLTNEQFVNTYTGTPESLIEAYLAGTVAAVGLTVGAIVGIAIGATVGTAGVGTTGYIIFKKVKAAQEGAMAEIEATPMQEQHEASKKKKGVDIFNFNPATFISITARHPPRKV
eukprot:CAMPEP_0168554602 /NCGR_PEP_ID=MMETSP0413-20121227/7869_1 /TAXON_ID=136452 /ORGANISM="Filamoeba nolandi, Strain NC-AS-23-1" /LENGTH=199 /DNA_ID=CAMNT_0008585357 /DNA_START=142 /DNA_END=741 /DNA_ORIENTATION=-